MAEALRERDTYLNELLFMSIVKSKRRIDSRTLSFLIRLLNLCDGNIKEFLNNKMRSNSSGKKLKMTVGQFLEWGITGVRLKKTGQQITNKV